MTNRKIFFIVGPTASRKTDVALSLASKIPSEIVSCDSMQVYKEISILSNKTVIPPNSSIKQHLIDIVSVEDEFDVTTFNRLALKAIEQIHLNNRIPLIVGGSGLYMQVLLDGIFEEGQKSTDLREKLQKRSENEGRAVLYQELSSVDPQSAQKIHPHDERRIIRALEVYHTYQKGMSELKKNRQGLWGQYDIQIFAMHIERSVLYKRINARVDKMIQVGLIDEIKALNDKKISRTAQAIIGIKEIQSYLQGKMNKDDSIELMKQNTRRLAKRQTTWFKKDKRLNWISAEETTSSEEIAEILHQNIKYKECGANSLSA